MKTIQMTLDEELIKSVDIVVKKLHTTRSAFTRSALRQAITTYNMKKLEKKHREGYHSQPVQSDEFEFWENEQAWGT